MFFTQNSQTQEKAKLKSFLDIVGDEDVTTVLNNLDKLNAKTIVKEKLVKTIRAMAETLLDMDKMEESQDGDENEHNQNDDNSASGPMSDENATKPILCKDFLKGKCKFGLSGKKGGLCPNQHPDVCLKHLNNGNFKGGCQRKKTNCTKFHVRICSASYRKRECYNPKCRAGYHLKNTERKREKMSFPTTNIWNAQEMTRTKPYNEAVAQGIKPQESFLVKGMSHSRLEELEKNMQHLTSMIPMLLSKLNLKETPNQFHLN